MSDSTREDPTDREPILRPSTTAASTPTTDRLAANTEAPQERTTRGPPPNGAPHGQDSGNVTYPSVAQSGRSDQAASSDNAYARKAPSPSDALNALPSDIKQAIETFTSGASQPGTGAIQPALPDELILPDPTTLPTEVGQAITRFTAPPRSSAQTQQRTTASPWSFGNANTSPPATAAELIAVDNEGVVIKIMTPPSMDVQQAVAEFSTIFAPAQRGAVTLRHTRLWWVLGLGADFIETALVGMTLVVAVLIRMWQLDGPGLSVQEIDTVASAQGVPGLVDTTALSARSAAYPFVLHWWMILVGSSDLAVRGLSALCGALTVALLYVLARQLAGRRVALVATAILAVSPLHIAYSQQVSPYALLTLASTVLALLTLVLLSKPVSLWRWVAWILGAIAVVSTSISGVILIVSLGVVCAIKLRDSLRGLIGLGVALCAVTISLVFESSLAQGDNLAISAHGAPTATSGAIINTLLAFGSGSQGPQLPGALAALFVLLMGLGVRLLVRARRELELGVILAWLLGTPIVLFLISFVTPIYDVSLVLLSLPAFAILVAAGIVQIARSARRSVRRITWIAPRRSLRRALMWTTATLALLVITSGWVGASVARDTDYFSQHEGEPWHAVATDVAQHQQAGDLILFLTNDRATVTGFGYYFSRQSRAGEETPSQVLPPEITTGLTAQSLSPDDQARITLRMSQMLSQYTRVWVVIPPDDPPIIRDQMYAAMPTRMVFAGEHSFTGEGITVRVSLWINTGR